MRGIEPVSVRRGRFRRWRDRWWMAALVLAGVVVASSVVIGPPASAEFEYDWAACQANSSAGVSFSAPEVQWLDSVQVSWSASLAPSCPADTTVGLVEDTNQTNENPQGFVLGQPAYWAVTLNIPTVLSGSRTVVPLRSLAWSIEMTSPSQVSPTKVLTGANITVDQPSGPLPDGQTTLTVTGNTIDQRRAFAHAVQTPNAVVTIAGNVDLDVSGLTGLHVAPNVQIQGDRSTNPLGPRLFTTTFPGVLFDVPASNGASHERFTGLRLDGQSPPDPSDNLGDDDETAILIEKPNVEVDHNEIYSWRGVGVSVQDQSNLIDRSNASTVSIHDNYIHHDQHPTGEIIGGGHGGGYGVETSYGAYALVERNVFDYNRHAIAGDGRPGTGYLLYNNLILPHGGVNTDVDSTHIIDMHGTDSCWSDPFAPDFGSFMCGKAGEYMDIEYNTVEYTDEYDIKLRGVPSVGMDIGNNVFAQGSEWDAIAYTELPPYVEPNNTYGFNAAANTITSCDFDGDGVPDPFLASGENWWYQSSRLDGRWTYLRQSTAHLADITLGDVNGDGLCDVTAGGTVYPTTTDSLSLSQGSGTAGPGGTATTSVNFAPIIGPRGPLTLSATGLPQGVTASFSPATVSAASPTSTLTLTNTTGASGTYPVAIHAGSSATPVVYQLTLQDFTLSLDPPSGGVVQGGSVTSQVHLTSLGGFTAAVTLSAHPPSGITATFNPATVSAANPDSTLTLSTTSAALNGLQDIVIGGTPAGSTTTRTATYELTVGLGYTIFVSLQDGSVPQGGSVSTDVTLTPTSSNPQTVFLSTKDLPAGVAASYSQPSISSQDPTATLTLTATSAATPGTYTFWIQAGLYSYYYQLTIQGGAPSS